MKRALFILVPLFIHCQGTAQCINVFPYIEDFENNAGAWMTGGLSSDWAWGTPSKPVINQAGSGNFCWISGGLNTSFYYYGERSFVESPCFDFTNLQHPYITFKIFWESERMYDGGNLQYSTDNGITWTNVGSVNDLSDCLNDNWYNTANVTNLVTLANIKEGWSGNEQATSGSCLGGGGSNGWKLAKHCMPDLAGMPEVLFRFTFGAGTTCNFFDGIAFDSVSVSEAPANTADFNFTCASDTFLFQGNTTLCPDLFSWNFGDPASGISNVAQTIYAGHVFSAPGIYSVTFSVAGPCNAPAAITKQVEVIGAVPGTISTSCPGGQDGKAFVIITSGNGPFSFSWNTNPAQTTDTAFGLEAGVYSAAVTKTNSCPFMVSATVNQPGAFVHAINSFPDSCNLGKGLLQLNETGGTPPYVYTWSTGFTGANWLSNLQAGSYAVTVSDAHGCIDSTQATVSNVSGITGDIISQHNISCWGGDDGSVAVSATGGTPPYSYLWFPSGVNSNSINSVSAGIYVLQITDATNCSAADTLILLEPSPLQVNSIITDASCGNFNGSIDLSVSGGVSPYVFAWNSGETTASLRNLDEGIYRFIITDSNNCVYLDSARIQQSAAVSLHTLFGDSLVDQWSPTILAASATGGNGVYSYRWFPPDYLDNAFSANPVATPFADVNYTVSVMSGGCVDTAHVHLRVNKIPVKMFLPNAFSPNGDGNNDYFEIYGDLRGVEFLDIRIFDRWGEKIFESNNPHFKWDGSFKGSTQGSQVFTWTLKVIWMNETNEEVRKGSVTLIR